MEMKLHKRRWTEEVESAYIITLESSEVSLELANRAAKSCLDAGMPYELWPAVDGTVGDIVLPEHLEDNDVLPMMRVTDHYLTRTEVACALSHISLWAHCAAIGKPIVIMEHDAILLTAWKKHTVYNGIVWLGSREWALDPRPTPAVPLFGSDGPNNLFICRAHAYAIDPIVASNMVAYVLKHGIDRPADMMIRSDQFCITHPGSAYAMDLDGETTINNRPAVGRTTKRNDQLDW